MKRLLAIVLLIVALLSLAGCGEPRIVHCDRCGVEIELDANSNITEDWIVFCEDCGEPVVEPG